MNEELNQLQDELTEMEGQAEETQQPELPPKYKNKSLDEIIRMHQEAEKQLGKLGNETGELRRLADELIKQQLATTVKPQAPEPEEPELDDADFFTNPKDALNKALRSNPEFKQLREELSRTKQERALAQFQSKHPDYQSILGNAEFKEWIQGSKVRQRLYNDANNFDADAADELFSTWKTLNSIKTQSTEKVKEETAQAVKAADVGSVGNGAVSGSKKIFRSAKLRDLLMRDPDTYYSPEFQAEVSLAYQEGRVK